MRAGTAEPTATYTVWNRRFTPQHPVCAIQIVLLAKIGSPLDVLANFETASQSAQTTTPPVRYAIRQALDQQHQKYVARRSEEARQARYKAGAIVGPNPEPGTSEPILPTGEGKQPKHAGAKRDFFGRIIDDVPSDTSEGRASDPRLKVSNGQQQEDMVWVSFHEGSSTAVRKPITLEDLMRVF